MKKKILLGSIVVILLLIFIGLILRLWQVENSLNQRLFKAGNLPQNLDGFYQGSVRLKTPWLGKEFQASSSSGINILNDKTKRLPFKTYSNDNVLVLDYNISENPLFVRVIKDELVEVGQNQYLGKAYLSLFNFNFPIIFFRLEKAVDNTKLPDPDYQIVLLGDSMTESLGNSEIIQQQLKQFYPGKVFLMLNYGYGSTNLLSAAERLTKWTYHGRDFQPIMNIDFDLILIESFGHNPLSSYPFEVGTRLQIAALDEMVKTILEKKPKSSIVFVATIAPNKDMYAAKTVELQSEERAKWAVERTAYIKNHIEYAKSHDIPVINIFEKSLNYQGTGDLKYIRNDDYIHPSPEGLYLISSEIANFIYQNNLLTKQAK